MKKKTRTNNCELDERGLKEVKMLNKIPVLDKGYVAMLSCSMSDSDIRDMWSHFTIGYDPQLLTIPTAHIQIRCPLFVQLQFGKFGMNVLVRRKAGKAEAYIPTEVDVKAVDLEASQAIAKDIEQTTEALLLNPSAYQLEACDTFISQVISPISVYNELVVSGTLKQWIEFVNQDNLPGPIEQYREAIEGLLLAEWFTLEKWIKKDGTQKGKV